MRFLGPRLTKQEKWDFSELPSLSGKVAIVTGAKYVSIEVIIFYYSMQTNGF